MTTNTTKTITGVARIASAVSTMQPLTTIAVEVGAGISQALTPKGNMLEVDVVADVPTGTPTNGKGVVFRVSGGVVTIYVWDGASWLAK